MYFYHQLAACFKKSINSGMHNFLRWSISVSLITLLCTISYLFWDIEIALFFHALNDTQSHDVFNIITGFGESQWYLGAGVLLFVVFRRRNRFRSYLGLFMSLSVAVSGVSADIIKYVAGRARPILYFSDKLYGFNPFHYEYEWISFPSGHATTAFSAAMVLLILYPRWRILFLAAGACIAFSRIFLTEHYLSDVIAGSFLGFVSTFLLYHFYFKTQFDVSEF